MHRKLRAIATTVVLALLGVTALFWLMGRLATPKTLSSTAPAAASPSTVQPLQTSVFSAAASPTTSPDFSVSRNLMSPEPGITPIGTFVARIYEMTITQDEWRVTTLLDGVMSRLTKQPMPSAEETLQRLINELLLLRAAQLDRASLPLSEAEARIRQIQQTFGISDRRLDEALASSGLRRVELTRRTARLVLVERAIEVLRTRYDDLDSWLAQARADNSVVIYPGFSTPQLGDATPTAPLPESAFALETQVSRTPIAPDPVASQSPYPTDRAADTLAPDFTLDSSQGRPITLSNYVHRATVVLVFYRGQT